MGPVRAGRYSVLAVIKTVWALMAFGLSLISHCQVFFGFSQSARKMLGLFIRCLAYQKQCIQI